MTHPEGYHITIAAREARERALRAEIRVEQLEREIEHLRWKLSITERELAIRTEQQKDAEECLTIQRAIEAASTPMLSGGSTSA